MLVDRKRLRAVLDNVLYVPKLSCNLFSIRRVEREGIKVTFVLIEKNGQVVATGTCWTFICGIVSRRFGHVGEADLHKLWSVDARYGEDQGESTK